MLQDSFQIYHLIQEILSFSLTDHDRPSLCSAKPRPSQKAVTHANVDVHMYAKFDQSIPSGSHRL